MTTAASTRPSVDYINPFINGVAQTWTTMLRSTPTRGQICIAPEHDHGNDITAIVGLSGPADGTVALRFPIPTAGAVAQRMLSDEQVDDDAMVDVICELVNIVGGAAKAKFTSEPPIALGLPTVIRGQGYRVEHRRGVKWLAVPFTCDLGPFTLEVAFDPPKGSA
jgi:chemotaxis protein CheX